MFAFSDNDADAAQHRQPHKGNLGAMDRYIDVALRLMSRRCEFNGRRLMVRHFVYLAPAVRLGAKASRSYC
jgi:hypothetical protein